MTPSSSPVAPRHWQVETAADLAALFARERIETVHAGIFDTEGVFREKRLPSPLALRYANEGWSFIDALPFWGPNDAVRADRAYRSEACAIDCASVRPWPFEPQAALLVADYVGDSAALSPRTLLARQLARARELGFDAFGASEFEFILLEETPASTAAKEGRAGTPIICSVRRRSTRDEQIRFRLLRRRPVAKPAVLQHGRQAGGRRVARIGGCPRSPRNPAEIRNRRGVGGGDIEPAPLKRTPGRGDGDTQPLIARLRPASVDVAGKEAGSSFGGSRMTRARSTLVSASDTPYYHCIGRCVRRAFLCGKDPVSGKSFEHRKPRILARLKLLTEVFAIDVCAYALMSNHYHLVVRLAPERLAALSDQEIIERWRRLYAGPRCVERFLAGSQLDAGEAALLVQCVERWRRRLTDLSWFMRCLNEYIARTSNIEDNCTGRFWEDAETGTPTD